MSLSLVSSVRTGLRRLALLALVLGTACSDTTGVQPETVVPHVTANIGGSAWAANYLVSLAVGDLYEAEKRVDIVGLEIAPNHAGRQITLNLLNFAGPGTYSLGAVDTNGSSAYYISSPDVRASPAVRSQQDAIYTSRRAGAGTVTITSYSPASGEIAGSFSVEVVRSGDATAVIQITNGRFAGRIVRGT